MAQVSGNLLPPAGAPGPLSVGEHQPWVLLLGWILEVDRARDVHLGQALSMNPPPPRSPQQQGDPAFNHGAPHVILTTLLCHLTPSHGVLPGPSTSPTCLLVAWQPFGVGAVLRVLGSERQQRSQTAPWAPRRFGNTKNKLHNRLQQKVLLLPAAPPRSWGGN